MLLPMCPPHYVDLHCGLSYMAASVPAVQVQLNRKGPSHEEKKQKEEQQKKQQQKAAAAAAAAAAAGNGPVSSSMDEAAAAAPAASNAAEAPAAAAAAGSSAAADSSSSISPSQLLVCGVCGEELAGIAAAKAHAAATGHAEFMEA